MRWPCFEPVHRNVPLLGYINAGQAALDGTLPLVQVEEVGADPALEGNLTIGAD